MNGPIKQKFHHFRFDIVQIIYFIFGIKLLISNPFYFKNDQYILKKWQKWPINVTNHILQSLYYLISTLDIILDIIQDFITNKFKTFSGRLMPDFWAEKKMYAEWKIDIGKEDMEEIILEKLHMVISDPGKNQEKIIGKS